MFELRNVKKKTTYIYNLIQVKYFLSRAEIICSHPRKCSKICNYVCEEIFSAICRKFLPNLNLRHKFSGAILRKYCKICDYICAHIFFRYLQKISSLEQKFSAAIRENIEKCVL